MRKLVLASFLVALSLCGPALAQTSGRVATPEQAAQVPAGQFVQNLGDKAIVVITNARLDEAERNRQYEQILRDAFDIPAIGRFVLGRAWSDTTDAQRHEFLAVLSDLIVKIYGERLNLFSGESFQVSGIREESPREVVVGSLIRHPGGARPTEVEWRVRQKEDSTFKVLDVVINGVSQSVTQRQEFVAVLERNGGDINDLLSKIRTKLQE